MEFHSRSSSASSRGGMNSTENTGRSPGIRSTTEVMTSRVVKKRHAQLGSRPSASRPPLVCGPGRPRTMVHVRPDLPIAVDQSIDAAVHLHVEDFLARYLSERRAELPELA